MLALSQIHEVDFYVRQIQARLPSARLSQAAVKYRGATLTLKRVFTLAFFVLDLQKVNPQG